MNIRTIVKKTLGSTSSAQNANCLRLIHRVKLGGRSTHFGFVNYPKVFLAMFILMAPFMAHADDVDTSSSSGVSQQLQGFNLNGYTNSGQKSWDVNGTKADISDDQIKVTDVDANFYGKEKGNLTADHGTINKANGKVHLQDNVVVTAERGTKMTTDALDWDRNKDLVSTQDPVKITDQQGVVTGTGLVAHPNLKQAQLDQDVKAVIQTNPKLQSSGQVITVTCDGPMQMDQANMYAVFNDHVIAMEPSTGRQLHADKMQIWFDQQNKKIKKAICTGHVVVIQGNNASYADRMVYNGQDQTLTMTGRPKIIFDTGDKQGSGMFRSLGK